MKNSFTIILLVGVVIIVGSCATIVKGGDQDIPIKSDPSGAAIRILDSHNMEVWSSHTPATVTLEKGEGYFRGARYTLEIEKDGYEKRTISIKSSLNGGWYIAGNLLLGGLLGWLIVDPLTGAMWTLEPDIVNLELEKGLAEKDGGTGLYVALSEDIPASVFESRNLRKIN